MKPAEARRRREDLRLRYATVARWVGLDPTTIMRWERGERVLHANHVRALDRIYTAIEDLSVSATAADDQPQAA